MATSTGPRSEFDALDAVWETILSRYRRASEPLEVAFSGGVDSSLLAWELRGLPGARLSTIGTPGSRDLSTARDASVLVGLPWHGTVVEREEVVRTARELDDDLRGTSPTVRRVLVTFALAVSHGDAPRLLFGQGADELFFGYAHYRGLDVRGAAQRAEADLERLVHDDWPRSVRIARRLGRIVEAPYLDPSFVAAARRIPVERRMPVGDRAKETFRAWARRRGLPSALAERPKRAMQYGSGVDRILRGASHARVTSA